MSNNGGPTFPSTLAHRSHTAFRTAAVARCITPFSGPNWSTQQCKKCQVMEANTSILTMQQNQDLKERKISDLDFCRFKFNFCLAEGLIYKLFKTINTGGS